MNFGIIICALLVILGLLAVAGMVYYGRRWRAEQIIGEPDVKELMAFYDLDAAYPYLTFEEQRNCYWRWRGGVPNFCPRCRYDRRGNPSAACPECGFLTDAPTRED